MSISEVHIAQLLRDYESLRSAAESQALQRKQQLYRHIPRIQSIDQELEAFGLRAVQTYLRTGADKTRLLSELKQQNNRLLAEKHQLMTSAGYPDDYLTVQYHCSLCHDTGYVDGKKCRCLRQRLIDLAYDRSNLKSVLQKENLSTFSFTRFSADPISGEPCSPLENIKQVHEFILHFIQNFPQNSPANLLFYGPTGTGKTFFCNCIAKALLDAGFIVLYMTASELCSAFEAFRFRDKSRSGSGESNIHELIEDSDLLIIDDLGTEFTTALSSSDMFQCINKRLLHQKATIISTNLNLSQISKVYTDRVASRISGSYRLIKLYGPDLRRQF